VQDPVNPDHLNPAYYQPADLFLPDPFLPDPDHLNQAGHEAMGNCVEAALLPLLD